MRLISFKKVLILSTSLLLFFEGNAVAKLNVNKEANTISDRFLESTINRLAQNPSQTISEIRQAIEYLDEGDLYYQNGNYIDAENSYRNAWEALRSSNIGTLNFRVPKPRLIESGVNILGIWFTRTVRITGIGMIGSSTINDSLDYLHGAAVNNFAKGNTIIEILSLVNDYKLQIINDILTGREQRNNKPNYTIQDIEDTHQVEVKIFRRLQQSLVAQNTKSTIDQALEIAILSRNLELLRVVPAIAYALDSRVRAGAGISDLSDIPDLLSPRNLNIVDIKNIAKDENSTLVYYSVPSPSNILIWVIRPSGDIDFKEAQISEEFSSLKSLVQKTLQSTSRYVYRGEDDKALIQALRDLNLLIASNHSDNIQDRVITEDEQRENLQKLHQLLIKPIQEFLPSNPEEQVVFLPQSSLFSVPFVALQDEDRISLIDRHTVRVAINFNSLNKDRPSLTRFPKRKQIFIVGNPYFGDVPPLPGAHKEALEIGLLTQGRPLMRDKATPDAIKEGMLSADILHFATHGLFDSQTSIDLMLVQETSEENSNVYRIQGDANATSSSRGVWYHFWYDSQEKIARHIIRTNVSIPGRIAMSNFFLTAADILNMRSNAKLAVLSACNTGQGVVTDSTILGLPFSFGLAGIPRVIVSLWSVPDHPTQILMLEFYKAMQTQEQLDQEIDEARALRQAMLKVKAVPEYRDPINWAGFTLMEVSHQDWEF